MNSNELAKIESLIFIIRDQKVMLDTHLAELYGVETRVLNQAVKRNISRFPGDFMFQLTSEEYGILKSQFVTSKVTRGGKVKLPFVFTENGLAMLSGVLNSERAIGVNIAIMRVFTKLRRFLALEDELRKEMSQLKNDSNKMFSIVFQRLDSIEENNPTLPLKRKKIGLK